MRKFVWTTTNLWWHPQHSPLLSLVLILTLSWVCLRWLFSAPELYAVDVSHLINLSVFVARRYAPRYFCARWNVVQSPSVFVSLRSNDLHFSGTTKREGKRCDSIVLSVVVYIAYVSCNPYAYTHPNTGVFSDFAYKNDGVTGCPILR